NEREPRVEIGANRGEPPVHLLRHPLRLAALRRLERAARRVIRIRHDHRERDDRENERGEDQLSPDTHTDVLDCKTNKPAESLFVLAHCSRSTESPVPLSVTMRNGTTEPFPSITSSSSFRSCRSPNSVSRASPANERSSSGRTICWRGARSKVREVIAETSAFVSSITIRAR